MQHFHQHAPRLAAHIRPSGALAVYLQHGVRGEVFTRGRRSLVLRNFFYDGGGPGNEEDNTVFFYAVNSSYPYR